MPDDSYCGACDNQGVVTAYVEIYRDCNGKPQDWGGENNEVAVPCPVCSGGLGPWHAEWKAILNNPGRSPNESCPAS